LHHWVNKRCYVYTNSSGTFTSWYDNILFISFYYYSSKYPACLFSNMLKNICNTILVKLFRHFLIISLSYFLLRKQQPTLINNSYFVLWFRRKIIICLVIFYIIINVGLYCWKFGSRKCLLRLEPTSQDASWLALAQV
jgi:hypothetical protein